MTSDDAPTSPLVVTVHEPTEGTCRLAIAGALDIAGAGILDSALTTVPDDVALSIDLTGIEFVDSSGIRSLIEAHNTRSTSLVNASSAVRRTFGLANVEHLLETS